MTYSRVDVVESLARRKVTNLDFGSRGYGNDIRAVDEVARILAHGSQLGHDCLELGHHRIVVICSSP